AGRTPSGAGHDTATVLAPGSGILLPAQSAIILSIHYVIANLTGPDRTGVQLWFATPAERSTIRPIIQYLLQAPSELPCPSGVSNDPNDRCSREYGIQHTGSSTPTDIRRLGNDFSLRKCGYRDVATYYQGLPFGGSDPSHFIITSHCEDELLYAGTVEVVHNHLHTRGVASTLEVSTGSGWDTLLDIPG